MTAPAEDYRVAQARKTLTDTETRPDDYGSAYAQRTELRAALEQLLHHVDELARLPRGTADAVAREMLRNPRGMGEWTAADVIGLMKRMERP